MEPIGYAYFEDEHREEIIRFKRFSYFPNKLFFSTETGIYCLNDIGFYKCSEVFNYTDRVTDIEFKLSPIVYITLPIEDEGGMDDGGSL